MVEAFQALLLVHMLEWVWNELSLSCRSNNFDGCSTSLLFPRQHQSVSDPLCSRVLIPEQDKMLELNTITSYILTSFGSL
jgi:hypothetical protein